AADAGGLRARHHAVCPDAGDEHLRALHRAQVPGTVRMTDIPLNGITSGTVARPRRDIGLKRRYAAERRFRIYGMLAISIGLVFLAVMLTSVVTKGYTAFWQTTVTLP